MAKATGYYQCSLQRGPVHQTAFIPAQFAQAGLHIRLRKDGEWEDGWLVTGVGVFSERPPDYRKAIRTHRDRTGDSLPKEHDRDD